MSEKKQWVQHISGQGEKWELHDKYTQANSFPNGTIYTVRQNNHPLELRLPRSEYRLCDPPEVWRDVTERIEPSSTPGNWRDPQLQCTMLGVDESSYRLRKVQLETPHKCGKTLASIVWAFIVEQKVTQ